MKKFHSDHFNCSWSSLWMNYNTGSYSSKKVSARSEYSGLTEFYNGRRDKTTVSPSPKSVYCHDTLASGMTYFKNKKSRVWGVTDVKTYLNHIFEIKPKLRNTNFRIIKINCLEMLKNEFRRKFLSVAKPLRMQLKDFSFSQAMYLPSYRNQLKTSFFDFFDLLFFSNMRFTNRVTMQNS